LPARTHCEANVWRVASYQPSPGCASSSWSSCASVELRVRCRGTSGPRQLLPRSGRQRAWGAAWSTRPTRALTLDESHRALCRAIYGAEQPPGTVRHAPRIVDPGCSRRLPQQGDPWPFRGGNRSPFKLIWQMLKRAAPMESSQAEFATIGEEANGEVSSGVT
jgi:hypothetical protein